MKSNIYLASILVFISILAGNCKYDNLGLVNLEGSGYPDDVGKILLTRCATQGCHNDKSKSGAAGLSMESWDKLFEGTRNGAALIPFVHQQSTLFIFTNTYPELGISNPPTRMPIDGNALTKGEAQTLQTWIDKGAPNKDGFVKFSDNPDRKKIYVTQQGCDAVTVFDEESGLPMRYISVGHGTQPESPHAVRVSPDGKYWYVSFRNGSYLQKFRTVDDGFESEVLLDAGSWNTFAITDDSKYAYVADWSSIGKVFYVDLDSMKVLKKYQGSGLFTFPHGTFLSKDNHYLYVTAQFGNYIYKVDVSNPLVPDINTITVDGSANIIPSSSYDPHEVAFNPDGTKYFVTCQHSNEVRVFDATNDVLIATIPVGNYPQEISFSKNTPYAFVTCTEDSTSFPGKRGSVAIINYQTNSFVKTVFTGWQPHGVAVDDEKNLVYVVNRNANTNGPAPHHSSDCGGRNGYVSFIDIASLQVIDK